MYPEIVTVMLKVVAAFEGLGVPYFVGGSLASSVHGIARPSLDADLVAALEEEHAEPLMRALRAEFHYEPQTVWEAIRASDRFTAVHLSRMFRVDVFVATDEPYARMQLSRRQEETVSAAPERNAYFATAEDIVLAKLEWYQVAPERPERHWADVLGVLRTQGSALDRQYLGRWAGRLGLTGLLRRALYEGGLGPVGD